MVRKIWWVPSPPAWATWAGPPFVNFRRRKSSSLPASRRKVNCSRLSKVLGWERVNQIRGNNSMKTQIQNPWSNFKLVAVLASVALLPALAQAHHLPGQTNGFASGLNHPLHGLDHILAMVAV